MLNFWRVLDRDSSKAKLLKLKKRKLSFAGWFTKEKHYSLFSLFPVNYQGPYQVTVVKKRWKNLWPDIYNNRDFCSQKNHILIRFFSWKHCVPSMASKTSISTWLPLLCSRLVSQEKGVCAENYYLAEDFFASLSQL